MERKESRFGRHWCSLAAYGLIWFVPGAHALVLPTKAELRAIQTAEDSDERLGRVRATGNFQINGRLEQCAISKLRRAEALTQFEGGRLMAFPYTQRPELISIGSPKTLTILSTTETTVVFFGCEKVLRPPFA